MDFNLPKKLVELRDKVREFVDAEVIPFERYGADAEVSPETVAEFRRKAKDAGIYAPQISKEYGGLGLNTTEMCVIFEQAGRSFLGPVALNCAAPDEGNMHLLSLYASDEQKEKYLKPLIEGKIRSCFSMTEPAPGSGSDPTMLRTRAEKTADGEWEINGHKWFISGAEGADFAITMTVTNPDVSVYEGATMLIVPTDAAGFEIARPVPVIGAHGIGGHCEIFYKGVRVPENAVLGNVGEAFKMAQVRLAPARLTHCMRWLGVAQRSLDIAVERALEREAFGKKLAEHEAIQWMIADSEIELHASRMMVLNAAWKHDQGDEIRRESSICKVFVAEAVGRIVDRAVQICGALGVSHDTPIAEFYTSARAFRIYDGASEVHRMVISRDTLKDAKRKIKARAA